MSLLLLRPYIRIHVEMPAACSNIEVRHFKADLHAVCVLTSRTRHLWQKSYVFRGARPAKSLHGKLITPVRTVVASKCAVESAGASAGGFTSGQAGTTARLLCKTQSKLKARARKAPREKEGWQPQVLLSQLLGQKEHPRALRFVGSTPFMSGFWRGLLPSLGCCGNPAVCSAVHLHAT